MAPKSPVEVVATEFSPTKHGFKFVNNFSIDKSDFKFGTGKLHFGLCGGMSLFAVRKFSKGEAMPRLRKPPASGTPHYKALWVCQTETLFPGTLGRFLRWQIRPDRGERSSIGASTQAQWQRTLRPRLKKGTPTILGLIRSKGFKGDPSRNHQVVAIGYRFTSKTKDLVISLYDPNHPGRTVELSMNFNNPAKGIKIKQSTGEKLRGFFVVNEE